ncbi:putative transcription factor S [Monocercomonoides exilis]|uniref:putative transcription factor S n=1 Tax=Monocercomonoides exilis TaxID=2049356 RepID=UPI003559A3A5|nr:putative transcription factor S [Monocercomonoides exilis]|eukprot:MONOS_10663.1-p1 / transcript=MONOS_10663.1 / gene=MONOS_10663 / organism=Monocercomonoides_exilis_PA203 / gene_product=transcription factor S / transcript_product=transcription factor S / location=Mono_scaffold00493:12685-13176(+) / protein_length=97 / sequence_SO=supercontig / SO=protein_coding / is_pseudo=false
MTVDPDQTSGLRFICPTCTFVHVVTEKIVEEVPLVKKKVDDVLGGDEAMAQAATTNLAQCPRCGHNEAYHFEMQTRSADEPATHFYKCVKCKLNWRE